MDYAAQAEELKQVLGLAGEPVAVTYTNDEAPDPGNGRVRMCRALKKAAEGRSYLIDLERSACPGGTWHCGLAEPVSGPARRRLQRFLTRGEKLTASIVSFERMTRLGSPPPSGLADRIVLTPLAKAEIRPDLVVFLCNAEQACRLITLDTYWDGVPPRIELSGSLCHAVVSYPLVTGNTNLCLGDWTARHAQGFAPEVVFLTVPYERLHNLVLAVPECTAGTAAPEMPPDLRSLEAEGDED